jgi:hypothetical protein
LSSKGVLVAALERPEDKALIIVASSHLDAGDDDSFKIKQLEIAIETIREFTNMISAKHPSSPIIATLFGSDMNIDGVEFWSSTSSYAEARKMLEAQHFKDSWMLTQRPVPTIPEGGDQVGYTPDKYPELGITSDQHGCVKRLDYIWVCPGPVGGSPDSSEGVSDQGEAVAPSQQDMDRAVPITRKAIKRFGVSAKTELNDGILWRSSNSMRETLDKAISDGNKDSAKRLASRIDQHDREMRLSDHAAVFAKLHFFPHQ